MLRSVSVIPPRGDWLALPFDGFNSPYYVKDIQGLDPVSATMVSSSLGDLDGEIFQSSRRGKRNIVIKLGFDAGHGEIAILRRNLYAWFMPKKTVTLRFYFDNAAEGYVDIACRVESFTMPIFAQESEATMSLLCYDPDFYVPTSVVVTSNTVATTAETLITYSGTVDTGFVLRLNINRALDFFYLDTRPDGGGTFRMEYNEPTAAGDVIEISTVPGSKRVNRLRGGVSTSRLSAISLNSAWGLLYPGNNYVRVYAEGASIPYTIDYLVRYGGL